MSGGFKTEAVVLRKVRFGEADSVLHLFTSTHGRVGAIAKGVRRSGSRFGGRLEPFFRVELMLREGRGDLATVTGAATIDGYPRLRTRGDSIAAAQSAGDSVLRLLDARERNDAGYNLLCNQLALLDADPTAARREVSVAFRVKLLMVAGFAPELAACASCGGDDGLTAFSPEAGGVVCATCASGAFAFAGASRRFLVEALSAPLADAPAAARAALDQAERAVNLTAERHAHVRLRAVAQTAGDRPLSN